MTNIEIIKGCYEAFTRGDLPYILERVSPALERWGVVADGKRRAPWHTQGADARKFFEALLSTVEPLRFEWRDLAAIGDIVYATTDHQYKVRATGKVLVMRDVVHRFRLRDGKIVDFSAQEDTALTCDALGV